MSIVNYARVAALFSAFFVLASFGYSNDFFVAAMFIGAFALFVAAVGLLVWVVNRYERRVASLSQAERLGLWVHESLHGWGSWRDFSEMIKVERKANRSVVSRAPSRCCVGVRVCGVILTVVLSTTLADFGD